MRIKVQDKKTKANDPVVSIVMNCFNGEEFLIDALNSILNQKFLNYEVIFWDNRSTDKSSNIFKSIKDKRFNYFLADKHTSLGEARNRAIKKCNGKFIAFLDCDDIWLPEKLKIQIPYFKKKSVGIVISDTIYFNSNRVIKQLYGKNPPPSGKVFRRLLTKYFISLETVIIRKKSLDDLHEYFDSRFEVIEEYDLLVRISFFWELCYVDKVLSKWRVHNRSLTWRKPELFPSETTLFLDKLINTFPNIEKDYKLELDTIRANISVDQALIFWAKNQEKNAFKIIKPYLFKNSRSTLIYFFIRIFGYRIFKFIYNIRKGLLT